MRIGLFGGTFNPVHNGHLSVARDIIRKTGLVDAIHFIPVHQPPHKGLANLATASDRWEMLRLALSCEKGMAASDVEMNRPGPSFTIDTVRYFKSLLGGDDTFFLIMGMDAFLDLGTWRSYRELVGELSFIVVRRPGATNDTGRPWHRLVAAYLARHISPGYRFVETQRRFVHPENHPLHFPEVAMVEISSTMIRDRLKKRLPIQSLVPEAVRDYIDRKGLYR